MNIIFASLRLFVKFIFFQIFVLFTILFSTASADWPNPEKQAERIDAHLIIKDVPSACSEAAFWLNQYPKSKDLWRAYIKALSKAGDEKGMTKAWKSYTEIYQEGKEDRELLECMAWAVIEKGYTASSPLIRVIAMLGAFFSQDAKGVAILREALSDENSFLRAAATKLSSHLHDTSLQEELISMLGKEKVWSVRLEVIDALGELKVKSSKKALEKIIASDQCHREEKAAAIQALVSLSDHIDQKQLQKLASSDQAGFRMLACEFIAFFNQKDDAKNLLPLLTDHHPGVRAMAMQTLGRLKVSSVQGLSIASIAAKGVLDPDPVVAINSSFVLTLHSPEDGMRGFQNLLNHPLREMRHLAAATLSSTGKYGLPLMKRAFRESRDSFVKMNLALGLIGQREDLNMACDCLYFGLDQSKELWDFVEKDHVRVLTISQVKHDDAIPNKPQAVNQLTRLKILEVLSVVHYPHAAQAIKNFLKESNWGITGLASALLLTEGDDEAVDLVKSLLNDSDKKVRVQAALILALWGDGDEVVQLLQEAYGTADREMKEQILEGIGRVGKENSFAFLRDRLEEPYQTLRIVAAAALLECLYH